MDMDQENDDSSMHPRPSLENHDDDDDEVFFQPSRRNNSVSRKRKHDILLDLDDTVQHAPDQKCLIRTNTQPTTPSRLTLTTEQEYALDCILHGDSIFLTGEAGTGKSFFLQHAASKLREEGDKVVITSVNALSALQIGGRTLASFSGMGRDFQRPPSNIVDIIRKKAATKFMSDIWDNVDVLMIDDISMLDPEMFRNILYLNQLARSQKKQNIQWILCGDFFQLPPLGKRKFRDTNDPPADMEFCFELPEWSRIFHRTIIFTQNFRQTDPVFQDLLRDIRKGAQDRMRYCSILNSRVDTHVGENGILPTTICYKNEHVIAENNRHYRSLGSRKPGQPLDDTAYTEYCYNAQKGYKVGDKIIPYNVPDSNKRLKTQAVEIIRQLSVSEKQKHYFVQFLEQNCPAESTLRLKKDSQVILLANIDPGKGLVNGARGVVLGFTQAPPHYPIVKFRTCVLTVRPYMWGFDILENTRIWYSQIPLRISWAHYVHHMAHQTIDFASIDFKSIFEYGQAYTILSHIRSLEGLNITHLSFSAIKAHPKVLHYYETIEKDALAKFEQWKKKNKKT